ncbi:DNA-binding CsgD family transcriptional regulator [Hamadaea flava]|uniref:LuxR C-terminal-related transcriptional regulator n=1 Tax=Hamadaea flava TaxID=1742688 RepID=A0ABV8LNI3_9ACTN|nr:LuxR C-terminal-related transcriptional regulator [Hamadaea flava]MCP2323089.1 DNA-binding CsgD family transcriptional regulator [Hamadaea flava]
MLISLGFDEQLEALYEHIVCHPPMTLEQLAASAHGGPNTQTMVRRLVTLGLVAWQQTSPVRIAAVPPDASLAPLYHRYAQELAAHRHQLIVQAVEASALALRDDLFEVVEDPAAIRRLNIELQYEAVEQVRGWDRPPYVGIATPPLDDPVQNANMAEGIRYRILYDRSAFGVLQDPVELVRSLNRGEEARVGDIPLKMYLIDESVAVLIRAAPQAPRRALLIREPTVLAMLSALFEAHWEQAIPLSSYASWAAEASEPTAAERELVSLLALGMADHEIAEHLGTHERTIRERVQRLKTKLGAQSRYEAGYRAAQWGWLAPAVA